MHNILLHILLIPAVGGLICIMLSRFKYLAEAVALLTSGLVIWYSVKLNLAGDLILKLGDIQWGTFKFACVFYSETFNSFLIFFTALFGILTVLYSFGYMGKRRGIGVYYGLVLWAVGATIGFFISADLLFILIFWEVVSILLFILASFGQQKGLAASLGKTFAMLGFSDLAMFVSVALLYRVHGPCLITELSIPLSGALTIIPFILFVSSCFVKAAVFPLHTWLPSLAPVAPASVMAFIPAALDKFLGIYLFFIVVTKLFVIGPPVRVVIMAFGAFTIIFAVMMALIQHNLKKLLAFHAISQAGYMILGIGTGNPLGIAGALFHMLNNAIYKSALFLGVGSVEKQAGTTEADNLGGLAGKMPITLFFMIVASLSISGVPPFNGFVSKWLIYQSLIEINQPIFLIAAIFGSALTLASFVKVLYSIFWGQRRPELAEVKETSFTMWLPGVVLALLCIGFGVFAQYPISSWFAPLVGMEESFRIGQLISFRNALWNPTTATGLIILGLVLGFIIFLIGKGVKVRKAPVFTLGEKLEGKSRFTGGDFYQTVRNLGFLKGIYADGEKGVFDVYNISGRIGGSLTGGLRALHNGVLSNYVSWCVMGLGVILLLLIR